MRMLVNVRDGQIVGEDFYSGGQYMESLVEIKQAE